MVPLRVSFPPVMTRPPAPSIAPSKVVEALVRVRYLLPRVTRPLPERVTIDAPRLVPEMSNVPLSTTSDDWAIDPVPVRISSAPALVVVRPV